MDSDAALRMIDDADRIDAETREVMRGLHDWLRGDPGVITFPSSHMLRKVA